MTKRKKIITVAISLGVVLILTTLFFITLRHSDLTFQATAPPREITPVPLPPPILSTIAVKADLPIQDVPTVHGIRPQRLSQRTYPMAKGHS